MKFFSLITAALLAMTVRAQAMPIPLELFKPAQPRVLRTQIPPEKNLTVNKWIRHFSVKDRARFDRFMYRGSFYKSMIQSVLIEHGVPSEFYYLAMIESGFVARARSHAAAVGIWQFARGTAHLYGLRVDKEVDERMDVIRSTRAAARLLKDLRAEFGTWNLAMAAYNCGSGCVRRAIRRGGSRDYWTLVHRRALPVETANYVAKFQAALTIGKKPEQYGFARKRQYEFPVVNRIRVPARMNINQIARQHNVSARTIAALNPHLIRGSTPKSPSGYYVVWFPPKHKAARSIASN